MPTCMPRGKLDLSPAQVAFLADRPGDCVVECVCAQFGIADEDCERVCLADERIESMFPWDHKTDTYKAARIDIDSLNEIEAACLLDRFEGSTMVARAQDEADYNPDGRAHLRAAAVMSTMRALIRKLTAVGLAPRHIPDG